MIDIKKERSELTDVKPDYVLVRDTLRGETHIKSKTTTYLPKTSGQINAESEDRVNGHLLYAAYKSRAEFYDATASSYRAMIAMAHENEPEINLPTGMNYLLEDGATDDGMPLEEFAKRVTREQLITGRCPILVDAPRDGGNPYLLNYRGEDLINWLPQSRYVLELTKAVQSETGEVTQEIYYLELKLGLTNDDEDPLDPDTQIGYTQSIWEKDEKGEYAITSEQTFPALESIPFVVAGSVDTTDSIDEVPLLPMSKATIAAYQMSADYRHALFLCGQPTGYGTGVDSDEKPSLLGSSSFLTAKNPQAKFGYMEVTGAGLSAMQAAISTKKTEADMYGVRVIGGGAGEAAETLKIRLLAQQATLRSTVKAGGEAIEAALKYIARWMGLNPNEVSYRPNMKFANVELDTNVINSFNAAINAANLPKEMLWEYMRASGVTENDNETIQAMIEDSVTEEPEEDEEELFKEPDEDDQDEE